MPVIDLALYGRILVTVDMMGVEEVVACYKVHDCTGNTENECVG